MNEGKKIKPPQLRLKAFSARPLSPNGGFGSSRDLRLIKLEVSNSLVVLVKFKP